MLDCLKKHCCLYDQKMEYFLSGKMPALNLTRQFINRVGWVAKLDWKGFFACTSTNMASLKS